MTANPAAERDLSADRRGGKRRARRDRREPEAASGIYTMKAGARRKKDAGPRWKREPGDR
jgi:hypothetical protein